MHLFLGRNQESVDSEMPLINTARINIFSARPSTAA